MKMYNEDVLSYIKDSYNEYVENVINYNNN